MPSRSLFYPYLFPCSYVYLCKRNPFSCIFCVFFIHHWNIFRIFAPAIRKECKTYCSIATQSPPYEYEQNKCYWSCTYRAQISRIHLWFVVNRVAYGESLRLLYFKTEESTGKNGQKAREKIISSFRDNYAICYVNQSTKV